MKKSIVMLLAVAAVTACNKKETTAADNSQDNTEMSASVDSGSMASDTATTTAQTSAETTTLSDQDKKFADAAAKGGMMEVMTGELAAKMLPMQP